MSDRAEARCTGDDRMFLNIVTNPADLRVALSTGPASEGGL
jgi:hypothetical protein